MKVNLRAMLLIAGAALIMSDSCASAHTDVTVEQARELIASTNDLIVVDVRERYEYCDAKGHIPGALNYPLSSGVLQARYEELPVDGPILVVCRSGGRSNQAANFLDSKGFSEVYDMMGGMNAWQWETAPCKYTGGSGTPDDPYQIATADDLIALGETPEDYDKHFILTADIDLDPNLPGRKVFDKAVIAPDTDPNDVYSEFQGAPFTGVFDGKGHTISNFTYVSPNADCVGLFGYVSGAGAEITDLGLIDPNIDAGTGRSVGSLAGLFSTGTMSGCFVQGGTVTGGEEVGGLVGFNWGTIIDCHATGTVTGIECLGGLVGSNKHGTISACYSTGAVTGNERVGGLVGNNHDGSISTSYSTGTVSGDQSVGGLVGYNGSGSIIASYSTGTVTGNEYVGGLVGNNWFGSITLSFWDIQTSGQITSAGGIGKTTDEMQTASTFLDAGWDFVDDAANGTEGIWWILEGLDYPRLWWEAGN